MKNYIMFFWVIIGLSCGNNKMTVTDNNTPEIPVKIQKVKANFNASSSRISGIIQAKSSADLSTRIMGFVHKLHVKVGDKVAKGQLLLSINNSDIQAQKAQVEASITQAEVAVKNVEKDYIRYKNLFAQNSATQKEVDDITSRYKNAKGSLQSAIQKRNEINAQFTYTNIRAPFDGYITNEFIDEGAMANPGIPLISIEGNDGFEVIARVPESEIAKIKQYSVVEVYINAIHKKIKGKITEISLSSKSTAGQYLVKISLDPSEATILSGMYTTVEIPNKTTETSKSILKISKSAIIQKGQLQGVYTISQNNKAILRWLRLGRSFGQEVEVLSGLNSKESYIISAKGKLYNGARVSVE